MVIVIVIILVLVLMGDRHAGDHSVFVQKAVARALQDPFPDRLSPVAHEAFRDLEVSRFFVEFLGAELRPSALFVRGWPFQLLTVAGKDRTSSLFWDFDLTFFSRKFSLE